MLRWREEEGRVISQLVRKQPGARTGIWAQQHTAGTWLPSEPKCLDPGTRVQSQLSSGTGPAPLAQAEFPKGRTRTWSGRGCSAGACGAAGGAAGVMAGRPPALHPLCQVPPRAWRCVYGDGDVRAPSISFSDADPASPPSARSLSPPTSWSRLPREQAHPAPSPPSRSVLPRFFGEGRRGHYTAEAEGEGLGAGV